ncbi:MAG: hypothetical protein U5K77_04495 [Candidatus Saccharibacteria bacterium]|nr:hypothetical protein [Candidatus Saccharibacteria bacterium]
MSQSEQEVLSERSPLDVGIEMAQAVLDNYYDFLYGGRDSFRANFPVNLGIEVHDIAHDKFCKELRIVGEVLEDDKATYVVTELGHKLCVDIVTVETPHGEEPLNFEYKASNQTTESDLV